MKLFRSKSAPVLMVVLTVIAYTGYIASCTNEDQVLDEFVQGRPNFSETELVSVFTNTPPTVDGIAEEMWENVTALKTRTTVPNQLGPENVPANFQGYGGKSYNVSMKSLYDNENIYFLIEWDDNTLSLDRETWYFDPVDKRWKQESRYPTFNSDGVMIREAFYEDKFAFLWNIDKSVADWNTATCYKSCHTGLGAAAGYSRHFTNAPSERIDMWHWKLVREGAFGTFDDQYQDDAQPNGRKSDPRVAGTGYYDNKQSLTLTGTSTSVSVPKYVIPSRKYYYWITQEEIYNGTAKLITAVDADGILTYDGGTIDPNTDTDFQRAGSRSGAKGIPSITNSKVQGNEGDITALWKHTGSGYVMEVKRKLNTGDLEKVDINFSDLSDQYFGIGVFENAALAHAIKANLLLKFKK
ncbi:MAG TPA: ethylbenzene dehydrogenase-related protein [Cyclobacteriaceae bacterium]|nr:ethylbenzene dehydrogenase-related protein [Cyclobacteriaceae bacterium]HRJ80953.1 ethylbenzene dehydrogenase-related protein [Cyclobacteriaceae bacterium]